MAIEFSLEIIKREISNKGSVKNLRRADRVPGWEIRVHQVGRLRRY